MISLANGWAGYYQEATVKGSMGRATKYVHDNPWNCLSKDKISGKIINGLEMGGSCIFQDL